MSNELNQKQKMFAKQFIIDLNGKQACIRAGYSKKTAEQQASRLLSNAKVQEYIQYLKNKRSKKLELKAEDVVSEIKKLAFGNATDFIKIENQRIVINDLEGIDTTFIAGAKEIFDKDGIFLGIELKFHDKSKNLDMLMRHLGQYKDKVELTVDEKIQDWLRK